MKQLEGITPVDTDLYLSRHNYHVFIDRFAKKIYKIQKNEYNRYRLFRGRYLIAFLMGIILYGYHFGWKLALVSALVIAVVLELVYRRIYLKSLDEIVNYEIPEKISRLDVLLTGTVEQVQKRVLGTVGLFILIAASAVYFLFFDTLYNYSLKDKYLFAAISGVFLVYVAYLGIINFKALGIKKTEWEEDHKKK